MIICTPGLTSFYKGLESHVEVFWPAIAVLENTQLDQVGPQLDHFLYLRCTFSRGRDY